MMNKLEKKERISLEKSSSNGWKPIDQKGSLNNFEERLTRSGRWDQEGYRKGWDQRRDNPQQSSRVQESNRQLAKILGESAWE